MSDISHLLAIINRLVDAGNTVVVIEHNWRLSRTPTGSSTWVPKAATKAVE
jgi:hypothetical protein